MNEETQRLLRAALVGTWSGDGDYDHHRQTFSHLALLDKSNARSIMRLYARVTVSNLSVLFYRLKAAICVLLDRMPSGDPYADRVAVTWLTGGSYALPGEPTTHWGEALYVGHGVLRGWWAQAMTDSD